MKTQAVVFPKANEFTTQELTLEAPTESDIVVRTLVAAISPGTERWLLQGKHLGSQFPCCPGYHRIGIVEKCGKKVVDFEPGDIVYGTANRWKEKVVPWSGAQIGMSVSAPAGYRFLSAKPLGKLELETLSFSILAGVANRGIRFCDVRPGQRILIIGAGFVGICAAQLAALKGAIPALLEIGQERIDFAKNIVGSVFNPMDADVEEQLKSLAPGGFDILYDTVGSAATTDKMVKLMRHQGLMLMQAQYFDKEKCAIDLDQVKIRELTMKTTCGIDAQDFKETAENISSRRLRIAPMITHRFTSDKVLEGYELLSSSKVFNMGIVIHWSE